MYQVLKKIRNQCLISIVLTIYLVELIKILRPWWPTVIKLCHLNLTMGNRYSWERIIPASLWSNKRIASMQVKRHRNYNRNKKIPNQIDAKTITQLRIANKLIKIQYWTKYNKLIKITHKVVSKNVLSLVRSIKLINKN